MRSACPARRGPPPFAVRRPCLLVAARRMVALAVGAVALGMVLRPVAGWAEPAPPNPGPADPAPAETGGDGVTQALTDYQLGQGLTLGPFDLAGYSSMVAALPDQGRKTVSLDDFSLYAGAHIGALLNPFAEVEVTGLDLARWGRGVGVPSTAGGGQGGDGYVVLERLYDDVQLPQGFTVRLGKMLAPVGEWNEIHAAPLVLSTVRPAATYRGFSEYATGLSVLYTDPWGRLPDVQVYWQPMEEFSARPDSIVDDQYRLVEGLHVSLPLGFLDPLSLQDTVGLSLQRTIDRQGVEQHLFGADFHYTLGRWTLQGEGVLSTLTYPAGYTGPSREWSVYMAPSYALDTHWSLYSWYEMYNGRATLAGNPYQAIPIPAMGPAMGAATTGRVAMTPAMARDILSGVAYRPEMAQVFRLEYVANIGGPPVNPTGLFLSWSVLF